MIIPNLICSWKSHITKVFPKKKGGYCKLHHTKKIPTTRETHEHTNPSKAGNYQ